MLTNLPAEHEPGLRAQFSPRPPGFTDKSSAPCDQNMNLDVLQRQSETGRPVIQRFYSRASVLVTGATGFMGKVLIEKLLRSCPDIECIFMMVREKKGRSLEERIDDLVSSACFDRIKRERPNFRSQLRAVAGDIGLEGLGLSDEDRHSLRQQVNIVFHVAATVRFDEHLKWAILQNVRGTREILALSRTFSNLRAVVHVSTAYANCPETQIDERFSEPHLPSDHVIYLAENSDVTTLDRLSHKLMGPWPNTYAFTKALSEDVVRIHGQGLPAGVFRPSIVVCTNKEPTVGWIDNVYGPAGAMAATAVGLLRTMQVNGDREANIVPCDMVINGLIASAWDVAENRSTSDIRIYNYVTPSSNRLTWKRFTDLHLIHGRAKAVPYRVMWAVGLTLIANRWLYLAYRLFVHTLPAFLVDSFLLATNKPPQLVSIYRKLHRFTNVSSYFSTSQWIFETRNVDRLWACLHWNDREMFPFDMNSVDWYRFIEDSCPGLRVNLLNDRIETLPATLKKLKRLELLHTTLKFFIIVCFITVSCMILPVRIGQP